MIEQLPASRDWIDILQALSTPAIAIAGVLIAIGQWKINKTRLRHELFEKRYTIYKVASNYLSSIVRHGEPLPEEQNKFIQGIQGANFIFDDDVRAILDDIWDKSMDLECLQFELKHAPFNNERAEKCHEKAELKKWLYKTLDPLTKSCEKYLRIIHK